MSKKLCYSIPPKSILRQAVRRIHNHISFLDGTSNDLVECHALTVSQLFDTAYYISQYPDIADMDIDPILHYIRYGAQEGRNPAPWFDTKQYIAEHIEVFKTGFNPFLHFICDGEFKKK